MGVLAIYSEERKAVLDPARSPLVLCRDSDVERDGYWHSAFVARLPFSFYSEWRISRLAVPEPIELLN